MFDRFKNLEKKQKLELIKYSAIQFVLLLEVQGAKQIGVDADLGNIILGWIIILVMSL